MDHTANACFHHRRIGDIIVTVVSDGTLEIPTEAVLQDTARTDKTLRAAFRPCPPRLAVNTFVIRSGGRTALIDTGAGNTMQTSAGAQADNLAAAGIAASDIDTVFLSHIHPDHSNGLRAPDGTARFADAEVVVHQGDLDYWLDPARTTAANPHQKLRHEAAAYQLGAYAGRVRPIVAETEVFPGVTALPLPGHTPGHMGFVIASGDQQLMIWGDTVHVPAVQVASPDVGMVFDIDPEQARGSRLRMLDRVSSDGMLVAGMHIDFPGQTRVVRDGAGFRLLPEAW